jgi:hypothetical protein
VIAFGSEEHLRLVSQASERFAVNDPIPIPLEARPDLIFFLGLLATFGGRRQLC